MSACGCNQFGFEGLRGFLVYPKVVRKDVEIDPVIDLVDAIFVCNLILPRDAKQLFSSHDYSFQAQSFVVVRKLLSDLRAGVEESLLRRAKGSYSSALPHHQRIIPE